MRKRTALDGDIAIGINGHQRATALTLDTEHETTTVLPLQQGPDVARLYLAGRIEFRSGIAPRETGKIVRKIIRPRQIIGGGTAAA